MSPVGQPERATQNRVIALFRDELKSRYLDNWIDREGTESGSAAHHYQKPGRYTVAVKVIDIFGNDTMALVPVNVG